MAVTAIIMLTNGIIPIPYESKLCRNCLDIAGYKTLSCKQQRWYFIEINLGYIKYEDHILFNRFLVAKISNIFILKPSSM